MPDLPAFHGWTHRPKAQGGTDPITVESTPFSVDFASYSQVSAPQAIPTGTPTLITFDTDIFWASSDSFASAGNEQVTHNVVTTSTESMFMYRPGVYWVACATVWETGNYAKRTRLLVHEDGGTVFPGPLDWSTASATGWTGAGIAMMPPLANSLLTEDPVDTSLETCHWQGHLWYVPSLSGVPDWQYQVEVEHTAGSDRDIVGAYLGVTRLAHVVGLNASV